MFATYVHEFKTLKSTNWNVTHENAAVKKQRN